MSSVLYNFSSKNMHMFQKTVTFSGIDVVNVYKYAMRNVYIPSAVRTLRILPTAMQRAFSKA